MSIIRNSTLKRRIRPETNPNIQGLKSSIQSPTNSYQSPSKMSAHGSSPDTNVVQKLSRLSQLEIPSTSQSTKLSRYPTVLRAGPPISTKSSRIPTHIDRKELFITQRYSVLPRTVALPNLMRDIPYLSPDKAMYPCTLPGPPPSNTDPSTHLRQSNTENSQKITNPELEILQNAINTLYTSSSLLIPPYLLDHLNRLGVVDNKLDFVFQEWKSDQFATTVEKLDRVQQFLRC